MGTKPNVAPIIYITMLFVKNSEQERLRSKEGSQKKLEISTILKQVNCKAIKLCTWESKRLNREPNKTKQQQ
jgi:hypothetical protein